MRKIDLQLATSTVRDSALTMSDLPDLVGSRQMLCLVIIWLALTNPIVVNREPATYRRCTVMSTLPCTYLGASYNAHVIGITGIIAALTKRCLCRATICPPTSETPPERYLTSFSIPFCLSFFSTVNGNSKIPSQIWKIGLYSHELSQISGVWGVRTELSQMAKLATAQSGHG